MTIELASMQNSCVRLEQMTLESLDNFDRTSTPRWPRHRCQVDANATRAKEATCHEGARCEGSRIV
jgi:hypothetical protein